MNKPYVKEYNSQGELLNPVTIDNTGKTFLGYNPKGEMMFYPNRKERRRMKYSRKLFNNRKPVNARKKYIFGRITKGLLKYYLKLSQPKLKSKES